MSKINIKQLPYLMPYHINWPQFFSNENPIDVEIGCGRTHFFFDRAYNFSNRNIIGIEWRHEFIAQGQRRIIQEKLKNAALFHGNAWVLVPLLFSRANISQIFINFPDPWWKEKHKKRLLLNDTFIEALRDRLKPHGSILVQTDVAELFACYQQKLVNCGFSLAPLDEQKMINLTNAKSHREKKCLDQEFPIYRGLFSSSQKDRI
jgi:tRNA (guanine-N7-)-methyltransferase